MGIPKNFQVPVKEPRVKEIGKHYYYNTVGKIEKRPDAYHRRFAVFQCVTGNNIS